VWILVTLTAATAFCSFAVDLGRVQVVKTELQRAADASARYAAAGFRDGGAERATANALDAADDNTADGTPVVLLADADVEFGLWDRRTRTFTPLAAADRRRTQAIRVTARRTAARGNAVPLLLARVVGLQTCDAKAVAIASVPRPGYAFVGVEGVSVSGSAKIDSWDSRDGAYSPATQSDAATVASNGDIGFGGASSRIHGDAWAGVGRRITSPGQVTGYRGTLTGPLSYPPADAADAAAVNDNAALRVPPFNPLTRDLVMATGTYTVPAGTYYVNNLTLAGGTLATSGAVTIYVTGALSITGDRTAPDGLKPANLRILVASTLPGRIDLTGGDRLYGDIYAPYADLTDSGGSDVYGMLVARTIAITGSSGLHFDESMRLTAGEGTLSLVQ
jgi:hypothetical protein